MSVIRRTPVNRLNKIARRPGGVAVTDALQAAQDNLKTVRMACMATMDDKLARIQEIGLHCRAGASDEDLNTLYSLSNDVLEIAGVFGMTHLGDAAFSFCDLLDRSISFQRWSWPAVAVHLDGLAALRAAGETPLETAPAVLEGLRQVARTVTGPTPA